MTEKTQQQARKSDLIRSSEFGDWLFNEIARTRRHSKSAHADQAQSASVRLVSLKMAKQVLFEFLTIQQAMLNAAQQARAPRPSRSARDGSHDSTPMAHNAALH
jgi:hypothetical protein